MAVLKVRAVRSLRVEASKRRAGEKPTGRPELLEVPAEILEGHVADVAQWSGNSGVFEKNQKHLVGFKNMLFYISCENDCFGRLGLQVG